MTNAILPPREELLAATMMFVVTLTPHCVAESDQPVTRRVARQCECKGAPAWVIVTYDVYVYISAVSFIMILGDFKSLRNQMETFSALQVFCVGNSPVSGEFPSQRPVTQSFDSFFDLRLKKRLSKQSRRRGFESPSRPLWRHCNE